MATGELTRLSDGGDIYSLDIGMYGIEEYSSVYIVDGDHPAVVETGLGKNVDLILDALDDLGIDRVDLGTIGLTHVHLDHAGGAGTLASECPNAEVVVHGNGAPHLADPTAIVAGTKQVMGEFWEYYTDPDPVDRDRIETVADGDSVRFGDLLFDVHHVPGHANHQVVYHSPEEGTVFTADALGSYHPSLGGPKAVSPPPEFDFEQCLADADLLDSLDADRFCFSHYGTATRSEIPQEYKSSLSAWLSRIARQRAEMDDRAVFKSLLETAPTPDHWPKDVVYGETKVNFAGATMYLDQHDPKELLSV